jgi:hypothetical protein
MHKVSMLQYIVKLKLRLTQIMISSIGNPMGTYEGNQKGGGGGDTIKLINFRLLYHYSYFFSHFQNGT